MMRTTDQGLKAEQLLTIPEVAERLRVSTKTVRRWIAARELTAHRLGRQWRVAPADLDRFLKRRMM